MKTRRSSSSFATASGRPKKRTRRSNVTSVSVKVDQQGRIDHEQDEILFAWSPIRIIRIIES